VYFFTPYAPGVRTPATPASTISLIEPDKSAGTAVNGASTDRRAQIEEFVADQHLMPFAIRVHAV
jgi:hypothetical protein